MQDPYGEYDKILLTTKRMMKGSSELYTMSFEKKI